MLRFDPSKLPRGPEFVRGVNRAWARISGDIVRTPLEYSALLSLPLGAHVYFKWECAQETGSFKFRGALNRLRTLRPGKRRNGIVSASTGNHGLAVSRAARIEGVALDLFLPENAARLKVAKIRDEGVAPRFFGKSCEQTEIHARRTAEASGRVFVSPYNDLEIIFGQGTIGRELHEDLPGLEDVVVPVGGGGLISGIAGYLKGRNPGVRVVGVEPAASAFMKAALAAGRLVDFPEKPTVADAVAGGMEPGAMTFPLCRAFVDEILTVGEGDIRRAIRALRSVHGRIVEGAGALPLAALLAHPAAFRNRRVGLVVSGGNISPKLFMEICAPRKNQL